MKKIIFFLAIIIDLKTSAQTTMFMVEQQNYYSKSEKISPIMWVWANHSFKKKPFGLFTFGLVSPNWGEIIAGPSVSKSYNKGFVEFGIGSGIEVSKNPIRGMAYIYHEHQFSEKIQLKALYDVEYGGSGYWYLWYIQLHTPKGFFFGAQGQAFNGCWGPKIGYQKGKFLIYTSSGYSIERKEFGAITGIRGLF